MFESLPNHTNSQDLCTCNISHIRRYESCLSEQALSGARAQELNIQIWMGSANKWCAFIMGGGKWYKEKWLKWITAGTNMAAGWLRYDDSDVEINLSKEKR